MAGKRGSRRKQPLNSLKERRRYWILKKETLALTVWITRFVSGFGPKESQSQYPSGGRESPPEISITIVATGPRINLRPPMYKV